MKCLLKIAATAAILTAACYAGVKIYDKCVAKKNDAEPAADVTEEPAAEEAAEAEDAE